MIPRPKITILTTGGTIAIQAGAKDGMPALGVERLLESIPSLAGVADVTGGEVLAKPSASLTLDDLSRLVAAINKALAESGGIVITHGTDTLEETAFALALLLETEKPVVLTGAMRRADLPGADGPANILAACKTAAAPAARGKGVLVVMNDEIHSALFVRKAHSFLPSAFASLGPLGWVAENRARLFLQPALTPPRLTLGKRRPVVPLIETGLNFEPGLIAAFARDDMDGIVLNSTGVGHISMAVLSQLEPLAARMPVLFSSRAGQGETFQASYTYPGSEPDLIERGLIPSGWLNARQARLALMLMLSNSMDKAGIIKWFEHFSR